MLEDAEPLFEAAIREAWSAAGFPAAALPPSSDERMQRMMEGLRAAGRKLIEGEIVRLREREAALEARLADIEERVRELEAHVGLGRVTLQ